MGHVLGAGPRSWDGLDETESRNIIRRLDPRGRVLAAGLFAVLVVSLSDLIALGTALLFSLLALFMVKLPARQTLKRMAAMDGFVIFVILLLPFTVPGRELFQVFGYPASLEGLVRALQIALTANAVVLALMALVGSMEAATLGRALRRLYVPEKLVHLLLFTVRYIDVLQQEYHRLRIAAKARGFRPNSSMHTYRTFGYLFGMMLVRALERSERVLAAMKCRGFTGKFPLVDDFRFTLSDRLFALAMIWVSALLIALEVIHFSPV